MRPHSVPKTQDVFFDDVILRFTRQIYYEKDERAFQLEVRRSPGALPGGAFRADVEDQVEQLRQVFAHQVAVNQFFYRFAGPGPAQDLADLGQQLYALLPQSFREAFPRLVQDVFEKGRGLRLVLEARAEDKANHLLSLPWEILFFEESGVFLARSPRVMIVRRLLDAVRRSPVQMEAPLNVIHVIADNPTDPEKQRIDPALQQTERDGIRQAIAPGHYRLVEKPGSIEHMLTALREQRYHIVHFLGHGDTHRAGVFAGRGYLRFVGADGQTQPVTGEQLQSQLNFAPTVQLVVLNACHGGSSAVGNIALELVHNGLPNVVAIQSRILQDAARHFIEAFYVELQRGQPIEYAVAVGRAAIAANVPQTIDWCLPVLYTNVGFSEPPLLSRLAARLWHQISSPEAEQWLGAANIALGALHLIVGLLLLLSRQVLALPGAYLMNWITGGLVALPVFLTVGAYLLGALRVPDEYPPGVRVALIARSFGSAALGLAMPTLYTWSLLLLLVSLGFWELLSFSAQGLLLGLIFIPSLVFNCAFSYSQLLGQSRAFISNAQIELPAFEWDELIFVVAGYGLLLLPGAARTFWSGFLTPPRGNLLLGGLLAILGYVLYRGGLDNRE
jgi:hypothetical protein